MIGIFFILYKSCSSGETYFKKTVNIKAYKVKYNLSKITDFFILTRRLNPLYYMLYCSNIDSCTNESQKGF